MWTIIELISKNQEISLSSRNNPEMSQCSLDVPMLAIFSIYIFPWDILWAGWYYLKNIFSIDNNANQKSETFNKSQLSEFFDVPSPCVSVSVLRQFILHDDCHIWLTGTSSINRTFCDYVVLKIALNDLL